MIFLFILGFVFAALYDVPGLIRNKYWKELTVYSIIFVPVFVIVLLQVNGVAIPSPIKGAQYVLKEVLHLSYQ